MPLVTLSLSALVYNPNMKRDMSLPRYQLLKFVCKYLEMHQDRSVGKRRITHAGTQQEDSGYVQHHAHIFVCHHALSGVTPVAAGTHPIVVDIFHRKPLTIST